jgi:sarcosine oxidase subunit gamma
MGIVDLHGGQGVDLASLSSVLDVPLPLRPWQTSRGDTVHAVWIGPERWRLLVPREAAPALAETLRGTSARAVANMTGAFATFRIVGPLAQQVLMRLCPLNLRSVQRNEARGSSLADVHCLLLRDQGITESWLILAPRSRSGHVAAALVEAARTPGSLALFEPAEPPPV